MINDNLTNIKYFKYWEYFPADSKKTRANTVTEGETISKLQSALTEHMEHMELFASDPTEPRHVVLAYTGRREPVGLLVFGDVVVIGNESYRSTSGKLKQIIDSLPRSKAVKLSHCPDPKFTR